MPLFSVNSAKRAVGKFLVEIFRLHCGKCVKLLFVIGMTAVYRAVPNRKPGKNWRHLCDKTAKLFFKSFGYIKLPLKICPYIVRSKTVTLVITSRSRSSPTIYSSTSSAVSHHFSVRWLTSAEPACEINIRGLSSRALLTQPKQQ